jgi:hypothetical protein
MSNVKEVGNCAVSEPEGVVRNGETLCQKISLLKNSVRTQKVTISAGQELTCKNYI